MKLLNKEEWEILYEQNRDQHLLQTYEWGELKSRFGWTPLRLLVQDQVVQILFRHLPLGYSIAYLPKKNLDLKNDKLWSEIDHFCKTKKAIFLKIEQDKFLEEEVGVSEFPGFLLGKSIQPRRTIEVRLDGVEDIWLDRMKPKTRYNIRLAEKKGIKVKNSNDIETFQNLMMETSQRDKFGVHSKSYYQEAFQLFQDKNNVALLLAYYENIPLAGLMVFKNGKRSWYFYGASNNLERNRMPTYLLQFEAMKWSKSLGCETYDLWGIPDFEESVLEGEFENRSDGLWGVYRFKRGFGGEIKRSFPALDRVYNFPLYKAFEIFQKFRGNFSQ